MGCLGEGVVVVLTFRPKAGSVFGEGVAVLTPAEGGVF